MTNGQTINDALRLLAERDVRIGAGAASGSLIGAVVAMAITFTAGSAASPFNWYLCGLSTGFAFAAWGALLVTVKHTRTRLAAETIEDHVTERFVDKVIAELDQRGGDYEAVLTPAGTAIQKRDTREPLRFH